MFVEIGDVLVSTEVFTVRFCCDIAVCKGRCCEEGEAGAPVALDEIAALEAAAEEIEGSLTAAAQEVLRRQGVVYSDASGELVTSIIGGRECLFAVRGTLRDGAEKVTNCWLCALERAFREGRTPFPKPLSCALYPLRERTMSNGKVALHYERWEICAPALLRGQREGIPLYRFLREPLVRRFGEAWYKELEEVAQQLPPDYRQE